MKKAAFTLIELLVVIAIIAILAALSVPMITKAIESGKAATDANNLKQLGTGLVQYLNDNEDDMFQQAGIKPWPAELRNYVPEWKSFKSPFDGRSDATTAPYPVSYGVNVKLYGTNTSKWLSPSEIITMAAVQTKQKGKVSILGDSTANVTLPVASTYGTHRSLKSINCLFGDSHVAPMFITDFQNQSTGTGKRHWDPIAPVD